MRTHKEIVRAAGAALLHQTIREAGEQISPATVHRWADRDSIPAPYWQLIARHKIATLAELAEAAASRQRN